MNLQRAGTVPVWDRLVRCFHWSLVSGFFAAYFTRHAGGSWHEWLGYFVLALLLIRMVWGFTGPRQARFGSFVRGPGYTWQYFRQVLRSTQPRYLGHNPLGGWMVVALITSILATCFSGWLYTTDQFWGVEWVEDLHESLTWLSLALVVVHVSGVIHASRHGHENLVAAMFHGRKRAPSGNDIGVNQ